MADIIDIKSLASEFKDIKDLQAYADKQFIALKKTLEKNAKLENENRHLKYLLEQTTQLIEKDNVHKMIVTPEQALIDEQISILQGRAIGKELTLEEIKKLDLLIKNKKLLEEKTKTFKAESKTIDIPISSDTKLLEIASVKDSEPDGDSK